MDVLQLPPSPSLKSYTISTARNTCRGGERRGSHHRQLRVAVGNEAGPRVEGLDHLLERQQAEVDVDRLPHLGSQFEPEGELSVRAGPADRPFTTATARR